jgi:hypothetical protein
MTNRVSVLGTTYAGFKVNADAGDGHATWATLETVLSEMDTTNQAAVDDRADEYYAERKQSKPVYTIEGAYDYAPLPWTDYDVGSDVWLAVDRGGMQVNKYIHVCGIEIDYDANGGWVTTITACDESADEVA